MIYRDLSAVADAFARCGKANSPAAKNVSVVLSHAILALNKVLLLILLIKVVLLVSHELLTVYTR